MSRKCFFIATVVFCAFSLPSKAQDPRNAIGPFLGIMGGVIDQAIQQQEAERLRRQYEQQVLNSPEYQNQQIQPGGLTRGKVIIVQQLLAQRGFDIGPPDGIVGPKTMAVVAQLQRKAGMPVTGYPTQQLFDALLEPQ